MRMRRTLAASLLALIVLAAPAPPPAAAQRPIPPPCIDCWWAGPSAARLTNAAASVEVEDARYRTHWTLTFAHPADLGGGGSIELRTRLAEGRVIVPLPPDSVVTDLALGDGTRTLEGRLLDAGDASRIYDEIVRRLIDPALLRSLGDDLYEIKAFPVPRGETREVRYTVTTPLTAEANEVVIEAPWSRMSPRPAAASLSVEIDVPWEVRTAIAPGHAPAVTREGPGKLGVSWESPGGWTAERDFRLHLAGGEGLVAARLLAHRGAADAGEDGYFALLLAPALETGERVARDIVVVIDRSGSMQGEKISQARAAAGRILDRLDAGDHFGIVSFADGVSSFEGALHPASSTGQGRDWIEGIDAAGLTNILGALGEALGLLSGDRPGTIVFLTDGLPTAGIEHADGILAAASEAAPGDVQLFAFGVGYDVDAVLLDALTSRFTGSSHYVTPDERIDTEVGLLSERISTPVLLAPALSFERPEGASGLTVGSLAPVSLGGIFAGEQKLITGRYRGSGSISVVLTGRAADGEERFSYELTLPERADDPGVALLWAQRRIADLLRELRVEGAREGLIEEIIAIANRFGIVTPYTAYLAEEPGAVFDDRVAADAMAAAAAAPRSGRAAVEGAEALAKLEEGAVEHSTPAAARLVGTRGYYLASHGGEETWIDEGFDRSGPAPDELPLDASRLARLRGEDPHLVAASALGPRVIALGAGGWVLLTWPEVMEAADSEGTDGETTDGAATGSASEYVVRAGDYLGRIARRCHGDASRWREIWAANQGRVMADGRTFSNPDLIHVGWTLGIPGGCAPE